MRRAWLMACLALGGIAPVVAFVFVPYKGEHVPGWSGTAVGGSDCWVAGDATGRVYIAQPERLVALASLSGEKRWEYRPPAGTALQEPAQCGGGVVVVAARPTDGRAEASLIALAVLPADDGQPRVLWTRALQQVPPGGFYLTPVREGDPAPAGLAVFSVDRCLLLDLATGQTKGEQKVGHLTGRPLWVEDSGFVVTTDGSRAKPDEPGQPAVVGVEVPLSADGGDLSAIWHWAVPPGEAVQALEWNASARLLAVHGRDKLYLFK